MSCVTLTASRKLPCSSGQAGIKAITLGAFDGSNVIVKTSTGVTALASKFGLGTLARFEVKNTTTNYIETGTSGGDNRSVSVNGTVPLVLNLPASDTVNTVTLVEELVKGELVMFIEYKDGRIVAAGSQNGALVTGFTWQTGGAATDLIGATLTIVTEEPDLSAGYYLTSTALTDYAAALLAY